MAEGAFCIIGAGGHAKVALAAAVAAGMPVHGIFDDAAGKNGVMLLSQTVTAPVPDRQWWQDSGLAAHVAIGDNVARARIVAKLGTRFQAIVHPGAIVHSSVRIGEGSLVCAGAIIQPETEIGAHCIINSGAVIEHDCHIGDFVHVAPANCVAGGVTVGKMSFLGAGAIVIPGIHIGEAATVGAGSVVVEHLADGARVAGVPARPIASRD
jgi:sugar O-acyltransferase (sialic acid O-acetyltransferase NeuD family)